MAHTRVFGFFVSSYGQDFKRNLLNVSVSTSIADDTIKVEMVNSKGVDLVKRYQFICKRGLRRAVLAVTPRLVRMVDDEGLKTCFDKVIWI